MYKLTYTGLNVWVVQEAGQVKKVKTSWREDFELHVSSSVHVQQTKQNQIL